MFLVRTAEQKPDEALLSINSFQKDLAHQNARVRAAALRVMSSIRVKVITGGGFSDSEMRGGRVATREEGGGATRAIGEDLLTRPERMIRGGYRNYAERFDAVRSVERDCSVSGGVSTQD